jgi:hypothetical protein
MPRIPVCTPKDVPENEKATYDAFVKRRGKFPDHGPRARGQALTVALADELLT